MWTKHTKTQPQHSNQAEGEGLKCSKTSRMTSSPTPTSAACQASLPSSLPVFTPCFYSLSISFTVSLSLPSWSQSWTSFPGELQIRNRVDKVSRTNTYVVKCASLFLCVDASVLFVCLITRAEGAWLQICAKSTTTFDSARKTKWICAHLAATASYVLCLSVVVNHLQTAERINKQKEQSEIKI